MQEVSGQLAGMERRLAGQIKAMLKLAQQDLEIILANSVFRNPLLPVRNREQQLDELAAGLSSAIRGMLDEAQRKISAAYEQVVRIEPHRLLGYKRDELNNWQNRVNVGIGTILNHCRLQLTAQANRLTGLNPKSVLQRGYSITTNKRTGSLIKTLKDVRIGDRLLTELADENLVESKVTKKQNRIR
jgi:exodeoxyribonuclease VII large subunit